MAPALFGTCIRSLAFLEMLKALAKEDSKIVPLRVHHVTCPEGLWRLALFLRFKSLVYHPDE